MKNLYLILISSLLLLSCNTTRKTSTSTSTVSIDSFQKEEIKSESNATDRNREITIKDSLIGIRERVVEDTISKDEQEIPRTKKGVARPVYRESKKDGITAWVLIDTNGNIQFGAKADSQTLHVRSLVSEKEQIKDRQHTNTATVQNHTTNLQQNTETIYIKAKNWIGRNWLFVVIIIVCIAGFIIWIIKR